jgi:hypothetical protein
VAVVPAVEAKDALAEFESLSGEEATAFYKANNGRDYLCLESPPIRRAMSELEELINDDDRPTVAGTLDEELPIQWELFWPRGENCAVRLDSLSEIRHSIPYRIWHLCGMRTFNCSSWRIIALVILFVGFVVCWSWGVAEEPVAAGKEMGPNEKAVSDTNAVQEHDKELLEFLGKQTDEFRNALEANLTNLKEMVSEEKSYRTFLQEEARVFRQQLSDAAESQGNASWGYLQSAL